MPDTDCRTGDNLVEHYSAITGVYVTVGALIRRLIRVAKMAALVYERENCYSDAEDNVD